MYAKRLTCEQALCAMLSLGMILPSSAGAGEVIPMPGRSQVQMSS